MPTAVSTSLFESLFSLYLTIGVAVGSFVIGWMVYSAARYRARPGGREPSDAPKPGAPPPDRGGVKPFLILTAIVAGILFPLTLGTMGAVDFIENYPAGEGTMDVKVVGFQWGWRFTYPNGESAIGELRVPVGRAVRLAVTSDDVFHTLGVTDFRIKIDAIPGKVNYLWFKALQRGEYVVLCYEFCGVGHAHMRANLIVMEPGEFDQWYSGLRK